MNISKLADMLRDDPALANDVPAWLTSLNAKTISQTVKTSTVVVEETKLVSLAEMHGGEATAKDVSDAQALLTKEPLLASAYAKNQQIINDIESGVIKTTQELDQKYSGGSK